MSISSVSSSAPHVAAAIPKSPPAPPPAPVASAKIESDHGGSHASAGRLNVKA